MGIGIEQLESKIRECLPITHLDIQDTSSGCGENYSILVVSEAFEGKGTLERHRIINSLLKGEIAQMHAFSQKSFSPKQYAVYLAKEAGSKDAEASVDAPAAP